MSAGDGPRLRVPRVGITAPALPPARALSVKPRQAILRDSPAVRPQYGPHCLAPGVDREAQKAQLARVMEHGREGAATLQAREAEAAAACGSGRRVDDIREQMIEQV